MSRAVGISLTFTSDLQEAEAKYDRFVEKVQSTAIKVPITVEQPAAGDAATFGNTGGQPVLSSTGTAQDRLNQMSVARITGEATTSAAGRTIAPATPLAIEQNQSVGAMERRQYSLPPGELDPDWMRSYIQKAGIPSSTREMERAVEQGIIEPHPGTSIPVASQIITGSSSNAESKERDYDLRQQLSAADSLERQKTGAITSSYLRAERNFDAADFSKFREDERTVGSYKSLFYKTTSDLRDDESAQVGSYRDLFYKTTSKLTDDETKENAATDSSYQRQRSAALLTQFRQDESEQERVRSSVTEIDRVQGRMFDVSRRLDQVRGTPNEIPVQRELDDLSAREAILQGRAESIDGGPEDDVPNMRGLVRAGFVAVAAAREVATYVQAGIDYSNIQAGGSITAGSNPVLQAQLQTRLLQAQQGIDKAGIAVPSAIGGLAAGAELGFLAGGPVGALIGAGIGLSVGQTGGGLLYDSIYGQQDAIDLANSQRHGVAVQNRIQDARSEREQEIANESFGLTGTAKEIVGVSQSYQTLLRRQAERSIDNPETLPSLIASQQPAYQAINLERGQIDRNLNVESIQLSRGNLAAESQKIQDQIDEINKRLPGTPQIPLGVAGNLIPTNPADTADQARLRRERSILQSQQNQLAGEMSAIPYQRAIASETARGEFERNPLTAISANYSASMAAASGENTQDRARDERNAGNLLSYQYGLINRNNREASYDLNQSSLADRRAREGYSLESAETTINADRNVQLRNVGGTGIGFIDNLLGYSARRDSINSAADQRIQDAIVTENRRAIGVQGRIVSSGYQINDDPLDAQFSDIAYSYAQQRQGITNPDRLSELDRGEKADIALARQRFANQEKLVDIDQQYTAQGLTRSLSHDPIGSEAASIVGSTLSEGNRLAFAGLTTEAAAQRGIGVQRLELLKQNYTEGFHGQEFDLLSNLAFNPQDVTNPTEVLNQIAKSEQDINSAHFGSEKPSNDAPQTLQDIYDAIKGFAATLATLASQTQ